MKKFIFGERNGIHIVDLDQTLARFQDALEFLRETTAAGGKVLFVGTKRQAQRRCSMEAQRSSQFYVNNRWLGGMLTNFRTVKKSLERFKEQLAMLGGRGRAERAARRRNARASRATSRSYKKSLDGIARDDEAARPRCS